MWSRVKTGLMMQSGNIPDLEEEVPGVPAVESLPPETLDHVVCTFKRAIEDGKQNDFCDSSIKLP